MAHGFFEKIFAARKLVFVLFAVSLAAVRVPVGTAAPVNAANRSDATGPTLHLDYAHGETNGSPAAEFMYFVPLISPEPVTLSKSAVNTQRARILSVTRRDKGESFTVTCDMEFSGQGRQQNIFDHTKMIQRRESDLKAGKSLVRLLSSISVEGPGQLQVEVEGKMSGSTSTVNEVRLHFNAHGHESPVVIGLHDVKYIDGKFQPCNGLVARVNTLTFHRTDGPPRMEVSVASVKRADAGDSMWQNFVGDLKGMAVNALIKPLVVERTGNETMLDFGLALTSRAGTFTFPKAKNLKEEP
ncbi:MAG TPA: hypothetical protein VG754_05530 [Verrucomicrobiae bacterium]|jgi:hypothetical protein|nr:hypothetical protein [Verrucomicrobiae bacterium]